MNARSVASYLDDINEAAEDVQRFCAGVSKDEFMSNKKLQYATFWSFLVIGEAASKLIEEHNVFVSENPALPWKAMKGLRNRIAHGYNSIDLDVVWTTIQMAIPQLLREIPRLRHQAPSRPVATRPSVG